MFPHHEICRRVASRFSIILVKLFCANLLTNCWAQVPCSISLQPKAHVNYVLRGPGDTCRGFCVLCIACVYNYHDVIFFLWFLVQSKGVQLCMPGMHQRRLRRGTSGFFSVERCLSYVCRMFMQSVNGVPLQRRYSSGRYSSKYPACFKMLCFWLSRKHMDSIL